MNFRKRIDDIGPNVSELFADPIECCKDFAEWPVGVKIEEFVGLYRPPVAEKYSSNSPVRLRPDEISGGLAEFVKAQPAKRRSVDPYLFGEAGPSIGRKVTQERNAGDRASRADCFRDRHGRRSPSAGCGKTNTSFSRRIPSGIPYEHSPAERPPRRGPSKICVERNHPSETLFILNCERRSHSPPGRVPFSTP